PRTTEAPTTVPPTNAPPSSVPEGDSTGPEGDPFRPALRFTPAQNWMNDPNGPVYLDGEYHLFFQHNPDDIVWGDIGWGHAVTTDLFGWDELDMALRADPAGMVFSGSAVVDHDDTSGLCAEPGCLVAIYTSHIVNPETLASRQAQSLAWSDDRGRTWQRYEGNPVLDVEIADFRDPHVTWHEPSGQWIMAVARPVDRRVAFYRSPDLRSWELASEFGPLGATDGIWECPVLVELPVDGDPDDRRWVLKVDHNPGHVTGGSGAQYFIGDFDGTTFIPFGIEGEPRWVDHGPDYYCAMQWSDEPDRGGERTWIAWMSNWDYASDLPTSPWRGAMTLPQVVALRSFDGGVELVRQPVPELEARRGVHRRYEAADMAALAEQLAADDLGGDVVELIANVEVGEADEVAVRVHVGADRETVVGYDVTTERLFVDRRRSGIVDFHSSFPARHEAPLPLGDDRAIELRIIVDRSSVEVFADRGRVVLTELVFPEGDRHGIDVTSTGGRSGPVTLDVWPLRAP
ncbi:MAG TPA: glycoside hydrolase family 32 protein, partial [Acidimicrobiales bacterium]|nr:glycoside hydrolase family 32 protein [Acidimicrobiales bacterium]